MAFPQVGVEAVAELSSFMAGMAAYNSAVDSMIDASQRAATEAGGAIDNFVARATEGAMEGAVVFGGLGASIMAAATKAVFSAARIEELETVLALVAKSAGYTSEEVNGMVEALEKQGIASTAAREGVLRVMQAQIGLGVALDLAKAAQDLAIVGQQESTAAYEDFIQATVTGNTMILRKYGIMATGIMMYDEYAASIAETTKTVINNSAAIADLSSKISIQQAQLTVQAEKLAKAREEGKKSEAELALMQARYDDLSLSISQNEVELSNLAAAHGQLSETSKASGKDLTAAQKQLAIATGIMKAAEPVMGAYNEAMTTASKNFRSLPRLIESVVIAFGEGFLPIFKDAIFTAKDLLTSLGNLDRQTWNTISQVAGLAAAMATAVGAAGGLVFTLPKIASALTFLTGPLGLVAVAVGALAYAFITDFGGIRDIVSPIISEIVTIVQGIKLVLDDLRIGALGIDYPWEDVFPAWLADIVYSIVNVIKEFRPAFEGATGALAGFTGNLTSAVQDIARAFQAGGIADVIALLGEDIYDAVTRALGPGIADMIAGFVGSIGQGLANIQRAFQAQGLVGAIEEFGKQVYGVIDRVFGGRVADIVATFAGDVTRGLSDIQDAFEARGVMGAIEEFGEQVYGVIEKVFGTGVADLVADFVKDVQRGLSDIQDAFAARGLVGAIEELGSQIFDVMKEVFGPTVTKTISEFAKNTREFLEDVKDAFEAGGIIGAIEEIGSQIYESIEEAFGTETADMIAEFADNTREFVGNIIAGWQKEGLPGAIDAFGVEVYKAIEEAFGTETADLVAEFIEGVEEDLADLRKAFDTEGIPGLLDEFAKKFREGMDIIFATEIMTDIKTFVDGVSKDIEELKTAFAVGGLPALVGKFAEKFTEGLNVAFDKEIQAKQVGGFVEGITADLADLAGAFKNEGATGALKEFGKKFDAGMDIVMGTDAANVVQREKFLDGINADLADIAKAFEQEGATGALLMFGQKFDEGIDAIFGTEGAGTIKRREFIDGINADLAELARALRDEGVPGALTLFGQKFSEGVQIIIDNALGKFFNFVGDIAGKIQEGILEFGDKIGTAASDFVNAFVQGLTDAITTLPERAGELFQSLGNALISALKRALTGSPEYATYDIALEFMLDFVRGLAEGGAAVSSEGVEEAARAISAVMNAIGDALAGLGELGGTAIPGAGDITARMAQLMAGVHEVINGLLQLAWDFEAAGHGWLVAEKSAAKIAGYVSTAVGWLKSGVENLMALKDFVAPAEESVDAFLAAVQSVAQKIVALEVGPIDEMQLAWAEFAAKLISVVASMIDDIQELAAFEGGLEVSEANIQNLLLAVRGVTDVIVGYFKQNPPANIFDEPTKSLTDLVLAWLEFNGKLVSVLSGMIDDMQALASFEGGLEISSEVIASLLVSVRNVVDVIVGYFKQNPPANIFDEPTKSLTDLVLAWLEFNGKLVSALSSVIDNLVALAAFEGGLTIAEANVSNLVTELDNVANWILEAINEVASDFQADDSVDALKAAWLEFSTGLISTLAGAIEDMRTLAQLEGDFGYDANEILNLVRAIDYVSQDILDAIYEVASDFQAEGSVDALKAAWLEFATGLISTIAEAVEDMRTLAQLEGDFGYGANEILNLVRAIDYVSQDILDAIYEVASDFQAVDSIDQLRAAWLEFSTGLISTIADAIEDMRSLAQLEGDFGYDATEILNLVRAIDYVAQDILAAIGEVASDFQTKDSIDALKAAWLEFSANLISTLTGAIEDMKTLAAFEGGLVVSQANIKNLVDTMGQVVSDILTAIDTITSDFQAKDSVDALKAAWLEFSAGLVSTLAGVVEDLKTLAEFKGDLVITQANVENLLTQLLETTDTILIAIGDVSEKFEEGALKVDDLMRATWLDFSASLVSTLAGVISDLETVAGFEGDLTVNTETVKSIIAAMDDAVDEILIQIGDLEDFDEDAMAAAKTFAETAGAVVEMLAAGLTAFIGLEDFVAPSDVAMQNFANAIESLVKKFEVVAQKFDDDMLGHTEIFASAAAEVVGLIADAVEAFDALKGYGQTAVVRFDNLGKDIENAVKMIDDISEDTKKAVPDAAAFAIAAKEIFGFIKTAIEALADLKGYEGVSSGRFRHLRDDIEETISILAGIVRDTDQQMLADAYAFNTTVGTALGYVVGALQVLASIGEYVGIGTVWTTIKNDIVATFGQLSTIKGIVEAHQADAEAFYTAMENVMGDVRDGFDILNSLDVVLPDWPTSALQASLNVMSGLGAAAVTNFANNINNATILGLISEAFRQVANYVESGINQVSWRFSQLNFQNMGATQVTQFANKINSPATTLALVAEAFSRVASYVESGINQVAWKFSQTDFVNMGYNKVCEFADGINTATATCVALAFDNLVAAVEEGVASVNEALGNLGVSSPKFQALHELNAELMQTAAIAAATLQTIAFAAEPRSTVPLGMGGGTTYNQNFYVSPTVSGNTFMIREEADIDRVTQATLEAMREGLGDLTSRRERY